MAVSVIAVSVIASSVTGGASGTAGPLLAGSRGGSTTAWRSLLARRRHRSRPSRRSAVARALGPAQRSQWRDRAGFSPASCPPRRNGVRDAWDDRVTLPVRREVAPPAPSQRPGRGVGAAARNRDPLATWVPDHAAASASVVLSPRGHAPHHR